jgi:cell wall-associated NlpC family hydrolase
MAYGIDPRLKKAIDTEAPDYLRPVLEATAMVESGGRLDATGDNGSSFGPYQMHRGGRLDAAGYTPQQAMDPVLATRAAAKEFQSFYDKGLRGAELAAAAQRPADRVGYAKKVEQYLAGINPNPSTLGEATAPGRAPLPSQNASLIDNLLSSYVNRRRGGQGEGSTTGDTLRAGILNSLMSTTDEVLGAPATSQDEGLSANPTGATSAAVSQVGTPYAWGGGTPSGPSEGFAQGAGTVGFDCSSLVQYAWAKQGVALPRTTYEQIKTGKAVPGLDQAQPGDLLFPSKGHVQMYLGPGKVIEAPRTGGEVQIVAPRDSYIAIRRPG